MRLSLDLTKLNKATFHEIKDADIREISMVHSDDGIPCNPEAKIAMYKSVSNFINNCKDAENQQIKSVFKNQYKLMALEKCLDELSETLKINKKSNNIEGVNSTMDPKILEALKKSFDEAVGPLGEAIQKMTATQETLVKSQEDILKRVDVVEKQVLDIVEKSKTQETPPKEEPKQETQKQTKTEETQVKTEQTLEDKIADLKKKLDDKKMDILKQDETYNEARGELDEIVKGILGENSDIASIEEQIEKLGKTSEDYQHEINKNLGQTATVLQDLLKSVIQRQDNIEKNISSWETSSKALPPISGGQTITKSTDPADLFENFFSFDLV